MKLYDEFLNAVLDEIRSFLLKNFKSLTNVPKPLADEVKLIANQVKNTTQPNQIRNYLTEYLALTSSFWRSIAPYTTYNRLLYQIEVVLNKPQFSPQSIQLAHMNSVHEFYLSKQKELIEPLQIEIHTLRGTCQSLQASCTALREENQRLKIENEFFMKELVTMQSQMVAVTKAAVRINHSPKTEAPKEDFSSTYTSPEDNTANFKDEKCLSFTSH